MTSQEYVFRNSEVGMGNRSVVVVRLHFIRRLQKACRFEVLPEEPYSSPTYDSPPHNLDTVDSTLASSAFILAPLSSTQNRSRRRIHRRANTRRDHLNVDVSGGRDARVS